MTQKMTKAGVIGWPVDHSRSPLIHGHWLEHYQLAGRYDAIPVPPDDAQAFFENFKISGLAGANITIPHKEIVAKVVEQKDDAATAIGAINTIWLEDGCLHGSNTDWIGFLRNLDQQAPDWHKSRQNTLILGAGGACRAIVYALLDRGLGPLYIANRTLSRAEDLKEHFGPQVIPIAFDEAAEKIAGVDLIVNTTSLGMDGQPPLPFSLKTAQKTCLVTDIVYTPLITPILQDAIDHGLQVVDGLGMLLHQAAPGFEKWFGIAPDVTDVLRSKILADLGYSS